MPDRHFDRKGNPITFMQVIELELTDPNYARVALDTIGEWRVSTVWLPVIHGRDEEGKPLIFETMVTRPDGGNQIWRDSSEERGAGTARLGCCEFTEGEMMTAEFKQAPRVAAIDGPMEVRRVDGSIFLSITHLGARQHIEMSEHTAARVICALAFFIGLPLSAKVLKAIKMI